LLLNKQTAFMKKSKWGIAIQHWLI